MRIVDEEASTSRTLCVLCYANTASENYDGKKDAES